jgi:hypothetical protein
VRTLLPTLHIALMVVLLAALAVRGMRGAPRLLIAYCAIGGSLKALLLLWPGTFYNWAWWLVFELIGAVLVLALAIEIGLLVFGRLPVGRRRLTELAVAVLFVALVVILAAPAPAGDASTNTIYYEASLRASQAKCAAGWLFVAILALSLQHGVPLEPLHRDVVAGLAMWTLLQVFGEELSILDPYLGIGRQGFQRLVYTGVLGVWAITAWRPEERSDLSAEAIRLLWPWRVSA